MDTEDLLASLDVGKSHGDLAVETSGTQEGGIEDVGTVRRGDDDDPVLGVESVHLDEELVEGLLALVMSAADAMAAVTAHRVDLVDENEAGGVLASLLEHVPDTGGSHTDKHLHEVGTADVEERHVGLSGDGLGQEGLSGSGGADHEDTLGDASPEILELLGILEEVDEFADLVLGLVTTRHVLERDPVLLLGHHLGLALAEVHRAPASHLNLRAEEEVENQKEEGDRQDVQEGRGEHVRLGADRRGDAHGGELLLKARPVEGHVDGGLERCRDLVGRRCDRLLAVVAGKVLGVATLLDDQFQGLLLGGEDLALLQKGLELRQGDLVGCDQAGAPEQERPADEGEGHGDQGQSPPVKLGFLSSGWASRTLLSGGCVLVLVGCLVWHWRKKASTSDTTRCRQCKLRQDTPPYRNAP